MQFPFFGQDVRVQLRPATPNGTVLPLCPPEYLMDYPYGEAVYQIWDYTCDGVADFARCPDERWYWIRPVPDFGNSGPVLRGGGAAPQYVVDHEHDFEEPFAFDFGDLTAAQWLAETGLAGAAGEEVETTLLGLDVAAGSWHIDLLLPWSTAFHIPDIEGFAGNAAVDLLLDEAKGPAFAVIRVAGHLVDVVTWLLQMSQGTLSAVCVDPDTGIEWRLEADASASLVTLSVGGAVVLQFPLG
jgi:hypothetical protein